MHLQAHELACSLAATKLGVGEECSSLFALVLWDVTGRHPFRPVHFDTSVPSVRAELRKLAAIASAAGPGSTAGQWEARLRLHVKGLYKPDELHQCDERAYGYVLPVCTNHGAL